MLNDINITNIGDQIVTHQLNKMHTLDSDRSKQKFYLRMH